MAGRSFAAVLLCAVIAFAAEVRAGDQFSQIPQADLAMKEYIASPGAPAVFLDREILTDAGEGTETHYALIKILTDQGKKYADIEIPYAKDWSSVGEIRARTVHADGTEIPFTGKPFEKMIVRYRGFKVLAKTFTLPNVEVGSVIEYKYEMHHFFSGHWAVQEELPTRHALFKLKGRMAMSTARLPAGTQPQKKDGGLILELTDIPAFQSEEFTLPADELKMRVDFFYLPTSFKTTDEYWKDRQQQWIEIYDRYIGRVASLEKAVNEVTPPSDPLPMRLRKLYARVQQIRNLSYEQEKSERETAKEDLKSNNGPGDVLKHGYGNHSELNLLFLALARAAGAQAFIVRTSERDDHVFHPSILNDRQFDGTLVLIQDGDQKLFLDPGTYRCPYGLILWMKTGTAGMLLSKDANGFISTAQPNSADALTERKANFDLSPNGTLTGTVHVVFHGQEALVHRLRARNDDEVTRREDLEKEIKGWLSSGADIKLEKLSGWDSSEDPLQADFHVEMPGFAGRAGHRLVLPVEVFQVIGAQFEHATRSYPIYFDYPYQEVDEVNIHLPPDLEIENLPTPEKIAPGDAFLYELQAEHKENAIIVHRRFQVNSFYLETGKYPAVKEFFRRAKSQDEGQAVLRPLESHAGK